MLSGGNVCCLSTCCEELQLWVRGQEAGIQCRKLLQRKSQSAVTTQKNNVHTTMYANLLDTLGPSSRLTVCCWNVVQTQTNRSNVNEICDSNTSEYLSHSGHAPAITRIQLPLKFRMTSKQLIDSRNKTHPVTRTFPFFGWWIGQF